MVSEHIASMLKSVCTLQKTLLTEFDFISFVTFGCGEWPGVTVVVISGLRTREKQRLHKETILVHTWSLLTT